MQEMPSHLSGPYTQHVASAEALLPGGVNSRDRATVPSSCRRNLPPVTLCAILFIGGLPHDSSKDSPTQDHHLDPILQPVEEIVMSPAPGAGVGQHQISPSSNPGLSLTSR